MCQTRLQANCLCLDWAPAQPSLFYPVLLSYPNIISWISLSHLTPSSWLIGYDSSKTVQYDSSEYHSIDHTRECDLFPPFTILLARGINPHMTRTHATGPGRSVMECSLTSCNGQTDLSTTAHHNRSHSGIADLAPSNDSQAPNGSSRSWSRILPRSLVVLVALARGPSKLSSKAVTSQQADIRGPYRSKLVC